MHAHMKNYVNMKHFMNHILIQSSPKHQNLQTLKKNKMPRNQPLLNDKHVFSTHIQGLDPMMPPQKKLDYDKSRRKHQNKEYNTSSNKMLTLGIAATERYRISKQNVDNLQVNKTSLKLSKTSQT